jgi:hypothetical protein
VIKGGTFINQKINNRRICQRWVPLYDLSDKYRRCFWTRPLGVAWGEAGTSIARNGGAVISAALLERGKVPHSNYGPVIVKFDFSREIIQQQKVKLFRNTL